MPKTSSRRRALSFSASARFLSIVSSTAWFRGGGYFKAPSRSIRTSAASRLGDSAIFPALISVFGDDLAIRP